MFPALGTNESKTEFDKLVKLKKVKKKKEVKKNMKIFS